MRHVFAVLLALGLSACAGTMPNPITSSTLYDIEAGYYAAEQVALVYMRLPLCRTGTTTSLTNQCGRRSIKLRIQAAGRKAQAAILALRAFVAQNPTGNDVSFMLAAQSALTAFQAAVQAQ